MTIDTSALLDARGMNCPLPILKTKKELSKLEKGETLKVIASDPGSIKDMSSFCQQTGHILISSENDSNEYHFILQKTA